MRLRLALFWAVSLSASAIAAPAAQRPPLATQTLFSAGQITDVDPAGTLQEAALYKALQSLIERYGIEGVNYSDKSVHKDWPITAAEAKVLLESAHGQLSELVSVAVDNELAKNSDDNAAEVMERFQKVIDISVNPAPTCGLLADSKFAVEPKKGKLKPLAGNATVRWADAIACFPGGGGMSVNASSYGFKNVKPIALITRGEFLHKLNEALDSSLVEVDLAGS
jgi:hypothetical protein